MIQDTKIWLLKNVSLYKEVGINGKKLTSGKPVMGITSLISRSIDVQRPIESQLKNLDAEEIPHSPSSYFL